MEIRPMDKLDYVMLMQNREFWQEVEDKSGMDLPLCAYVKTGAVSVRGGLILSNDGVYLSMREVMNYYAGLRELINNHFIAPNERDRGLLNMMRGVLQDYPKMSLGFWIKPAMVCEKLCTHRLMACMSITLPGKKNNGIIYPAKIGLIAVHWHEFADHIDLNKEVVDNFESILVRVRLEKTIKKAL